jgi:DNA-directed RNA polymerase specialized sigma24 family protein
MSGREAGAEVSGLTSGDAWFASFAEAGPTRLRVALVSAYGVEVGSEAAAEAVSYAWEHRARLAPMANPLGYLFRVGQSATRRHWRWRRSVVLPPVPTHLEPTVDPDLVAALGRLSDRQRVAVVLVHVNDWTLEDAAEAMGVEVSTVRVHLGRALARLRTILGEDHR